MKKEILLEALSRKTNIQNVNIPEQLCPIFGEDRSIFGHYRAIRHNIRILTNRILGSGDHKTHV